MNVILIFTSWMCSHVVYIADNGTRCGGMLNLTCENHIMGDIMKHAPCMSPPPVFVLYCELVPVFVLCVCQFVVSTIPILFTQCTV